MNAVRGLVEGEVERDPAQAIQRLASQEPGVRVESIPALIEKWATYAPGEAAAWLAQQPELPALSQTVGELVESWSYVNPMEASQWAATLEKGPLRDEAAAQVAELVSAHDPEAALHWAASIEAARSREILLSKLLP